MTAVDGASSRAKSPSGGPARSWHQRPRAGGARPARRLRRAGAPRRSPRDARHRHGHQGRHPPDDAGAGGPEARYRLLGGAVGPRRHCPLVPRHAADRRCLRRRHDPAHAVRRLAPVAARGLPGRAPRCPWPAPWPPPSSRGAWPAGVDGLADGWPAFWLAGLASPLAVYALDLWEHTLGVAFMGGGVLLLVDVVPGVTGRVAAPCCGPAPPAAALGWPTRCAPKRSCTRFPPSVSCWSRWSSAAGDGRRRSGRGSPAWPASPWCSPPTPPSSSSPSAARSARAARAERRPAPVPTCPTACARAWSRWPHRSRASPSRTSSSA